MKVAMMLAVAAICTAAGPAVGASACEGSQVVFDDKFADDAGGWAVNPDIEVKDGSFTIKLPPDSMEANLNITHTVQDADICSESVWADGDGKVLGAGLLFWGEDSRSYYQFGVLNNGKFWIARRQDGKWDTVVENMQSTAIKTSAGAANTLRVKVQGNFVSFFINGNKVRELRGQPPKAGWRFGLSGDNFNKEKEARVVFKTFKVTE